MRSAFRSRRIAVLSLVGPALLAAAALSGCLPEEDPGYDKVAFRRPDPLPAPAVPLPPPVRAGAPGAATPAPELAAGELPPGITLEMVSEGQQLYGTVCVACHGAAGTGSPVGPALNDQQWIHITGEYEEIVSITTSGVMQPRQYPSAMPPRGGGAFTDEQIRAIAAYVFAISRAGGGT